MPTNPHDSCQLPAPPARFPLPWSLCSRWSRTLLTSCAILLTLGCTGCAEQPNRAVPSAAVHPGASLATEPPANRACVGGYRAKQLTGDFAGYASLKQFIDQMVHKHGFEEEYLLGLFSQARRKDWTLNYLAKSDQKLKGPPSPGGWSRYRAKFLNERCIGAGIDFAHRNQATLQRASRQYGVPEEYILAILAVETIFGGYVGKDRVLDSLTTLGFDYARRGDYFRGELESFLVMTRNEGMDPTVPVGSYAGAMGPGQFMPTSFLRWAVDFNGDGRRDLWNVEDTIGSVANYLAQHGWQPGQPVVTPLLTSGPVSLEAGLTPQYTLADLRQAGLRTARPCRDDGPLRLIRLRHAGYDQYLIGHPNFYTITRYNNSAYYAMAVHEMAQSIKSRL